MHACLKGSYSAHEFPDKWGIRKVHITGNKQFERQHISIFATEDRKTRKDICIKMWVINWDLWVVPEA
eukprot:1155038-Pelagomonas_calceolata.AAC.4